MNPKDIEASLDQGDQLPSVDDAKLNASMAQPPRKSLTKQTFWIVLSAVAAVFLLSGVSIALSQSDANANPSNKNIPSDADSLGAIMDTLNIFAKVSSYDDLVTTGSPQNRALAWIAEADYLGKYYLENNQLDEALQRYILAVFFYAMDGENWENDLHFLTTKDVCHWFSTTVDSSIQIRSIFDGVWCNQGGGTVQDIRIPPNYLKGSLPSELKYLKELEVIDFGHNPGITGGFPTFVKSLSKLQYLGLQYNEMEGELPEWLDSMKSLVTMVLSNNRFTGTVPSSLSRMTNLQYLYLDDNLLRGDIVMFTPLTNLKHLMAEDNLFEGKIDEEMAVQLSDLAILDASHNLIGSTLPPNFWSGLKSLQVLDLHENSISGTFPRVESAHPLQFLAINDNILSGEIPSSLNEFPALKHLDLAHNRFQSTIPKSLGSLLHLEYLFLSGNPLQRGEMPLSMMGLTNLVDLSLKECNLAGTIPMWLGNFRHLMLLDLAENAFTGEVPIQIGFLHSLKHLLLHRNQLEGGLPDSLNQLTNLETLLLDHNSITSQSVCQGNNPPKVFVTDCGGPNPTLACDCCVLCCEPTDDFCNDQKWLAAIDPIWEYGFQRGNDEYAFFGNP